MLVYCGNVNAPKFVKTFIVISVDLPQCPVIKVSCYDGRFNVIECFF